MPDDPAEPFYAAIRAAPDDDLPRLVFADWLDEHGQPERAESIRLACAVAREPDGERKRVWLARVFELFRTHRADWFGSLPTAFPQHRLDRGFITSIAGSPLRLFERAPELTRFAPCLARLGTAATAADAGVVLTLDVVHRVTHLLLDRVATAALDSLAAHVELPNLSELFVQTTGLGGLPEGARFTEWCLVRKARTLRMGVGFGGIDGADAGRVRSDITCAFVRRHLDLPNLRELRLWGVNEAVARDLANWPRLRQLVGLNLHDCCVVEGSLPILLPRLRETNVEAIGLGQNSLGDSAMRHVADTRYPPTLRELRLDRNRIGDAGVETLIASPHLRDDLVLHIGNNVYNGRSAARLRERFPNVRF